MAFLHMADGRTYRTDAEYTPLRSCIFEDKTDPIEGVVFGPGNPPAWIEVAVQGGYIAFNRAQVVAVRP